MAKSRSVRGIEVESYRDRVIISVPKGWEGEMLTYKQAMRLEEVLWDAAVAAGEWLPPRVQAKRDKAKAEYKAWKDSLPPYARVGP